jgi:hypothetical protein
MESIVALILTIDLVEHEQAKGQLLSFPSRRDNSCGPHGLELGMR